MSENAAVAEASKRAASEGALAKLVLFSLSLGVIPLASYYGSLAYVWQGNSTYSAITAIIAANLILVAYVVTSILEDRAATTFGKDVVSSSTETKKDK